MTKSQCNANTYSYFCNHGERKGLSALLVIQWTQRKSYSTITTSYLAGPQSQNPFRVGLCHCSVLTGVSVAQSSVARLSVREVSLGLSRTLYVTGSLGQKDHNMYIFRLSSLLLVPVWIEMNECIILYNNTFFKYVKCYLRIFYYVLYKIIIFFTFIYSFGQL